MPQFDIIHFSSQIFWLIISFSLLYFIVSKFVVPKAEFIMNNRNQAIQDNINEAEEYKSQAKILDIEQKENLALLDDQIDTMQHKSIELLKTDIENKRSKLKLELKSKKEDFLKKVDQDIGQFYQSKTTAYIDLAAFIIQQITNKPADRKLLHDIQENNL